MATSCSTSSSTSAAGNPYNESFHVFINHRGVDVKNSFARSLYLRLHDNGLTAFLDDEEMQQGYNISSQLEHAIRNASAHVAIFSRRYAESYWCLTELLLMLETKAPIIPVFYGVTPAEVRWTEGTDGMYDQALKTLARKRNHNGTMRYESSTINKWRNALSEVANNSGFDLETCNGGDLELLDKMVNCLSKIIKKPESPVAKHPTGLDEKLKDFENTVMSGKPQIVGIVGLGGVGKTTLAKEFFKRKKSNYKKSCFLFDVRDAKGNLTELQRQLRKSLISIDKPINSVHEGIGMLDVAFKSFNPPEKLDHVENAPEKLDHVENAPETLDHVENARGALIVVDDVNNVEQVDALLPVELCPGSLILITSRDKHVLLASKIEISSIYRLTGLNYQDSRELFCMHAFNQTYPRKGFEPLVDSFLETCEGLPLSLKIFGANLYGQEIPYWKEELKTLPRELEEKLKISYDALSHEEQQMFLDIACFFIGRNKDTAISIWESSGYKPRKGFQNLQDKCLVEVHSSRNVIDMHHHLRDMGRDLAEKLLPRRLLRWTQNVIEDLSQQQSFIQARGIKMNLGEYNDAIDGLGHIRTRRLHFLETEGDVVESILTSAESPRLTWLIWKNCPHSSLPSSLPVKYLVALEVGGRGLNTLWQREGESEGPLQLPLCLEELIAVDCVNLKRIHGLEQLTKLRILNVSGCSEIEELPSMEKLVSLEVLLARGCVKLKGIRGLAQCRELRKLDVGECSELKELQSMETLLSLEELWADRCVQLKRIKGLEQATKLKQLNVSGCNELEELPSIETLLSLEELWSVGCVKLKSIRWCAQSPKLRKLFAGECSALKELPSMEMLVSLEVLCTHGCVNLKTIPGLTQAKKLQELCIFGCTDLVELPSLETLVSLKSLRAEECVQLKSIRGLARCTELRTLRVAKCPALEELPNMEMLLSLEELCTHGCVKLKSIRGLTQAKKLQSLCIYGCTELVELPSLETLVSLKSLNVRGCVQLKSIPGLALCTELRKLNVAECPELEELPSMESWVSLEVFCADGCGQLKSIRGLEQATKLKYLCVSNCTELVELPCMETLVSLEELWAERCVKLKSIRGFTQCTELRMLGVADCPELEELPSMEMLVSLELLCTHRCVKLKSIRGLFRATKLKSLCIYECSKLEELPSMEKLFSLENLFANQCVQLKRIMGLEQATKLRHLDVSMCTELEELPSLETLVYLEGLLAAGCVKLKSIRGVGQLTKLKHLNLIGCSLGAPS